MKKTVLLAAVVAVCGNAAAVLSDAEAEAKAREILAKMTLEEKVSLTGGNSTMYLNAIPRVGIAREWAMSDCSHAMKPEHGRRVWQYVKDVDDRSTSLAPLEAVAATWNPALAALHGQVMGEQMRARGKDMMLGPGVNIQRTPLCGRNWEYMGEDPYLAGRLVVPLVRAVQANGVAATAKHFCLNNQELARNTVDTVVDERTLNEIYLPAFRAAIVDGGALAVMTAYNKVNGVYCSENAYLQRGILRDRWGFKGLIVTDWGGQHSTVDAALNGGNVEMDQGCDIRHFTRPFAAEGESRQPLADAVRAGEVPEATVDEMAFHVLYVMAKTGFLSGAQPKGERLTPRHQSAARTIGEEAVTLLKNRKGVLPLVRGTVKRLVLVGNQCDRPQAHLGCSCESHPAYEITAFAGLRELLGENVAIERFPLGGEAGGEKMTPVDNLLLETVDPTAKEAFVVRAWEEECWEKRFFEGKSAKKGFVKYPSLVTDKPSPWLSIRWTAKVRAPESGRFLLGFEQKPGTFAHIKVDGAEIGGWSEGNFLQETTFEKGRVYEIAIDFHPEEGAVDGRFGWVLPSARISGEQIRAAAEKADAVVVFTGTEMGGGRAHESEGGDRPSMVGPVGHDAAIADMLTWNLKRLVVVCRSGSPVELPWEPQCDTLVRSPYLGQEEGRVLAKVLFGDVNPSGKLPETWPRRYADTPVATCGTYNDRKVVYNERFYVGYRWYDSKKVEPMFPFGYGLSYTTFAYSDLKVAVVRGVASCTSGKDSASPLSAADGWDVTVQITNTGARDGKETAELYLHALGSKVERVEQELKGFDKVFVKAGGTATARMRVTPRDLAYYDVLSHRWRADAGRYELRVGPSSRETPLRAEIVLDHDIVFGE